MTGIPEEIIIEELLKKFGNISREEIEKKVREKIEEFGGIIKREAALIILAKELGIPIPKENLSLFALRIRDLAVGFRNVDVEGVVINRQPLMKSSTGKEYLRFALADENDFIWAVAWGEKAVELDAQLRIGQKVVVSRVSVKKYRDRKELVIDKNTTLKVIGEVDLQGLLELSKRFGHPIIIAKALKKIEEYSGIVLYGFDEECTPTSIKMPLKPCFNLKEGETFLLSNCSRTLSGDYSQITCRETTYLQRLEGKTEVCKGKSLDTLFVKGVLVGYETFMREGGKVYLVNDSGLQTFIFFRDKLLGEASKLLFRRVRIWGYRKLNDSLRETPLTMLEDEGEWKKPGFEKGKRFLEHEGFLETTASVVNVNLKHKCLRSHSLFTVYLALDDGTLTLNFLSNSPQTLREVFYLTPEEICELDTDTLKKIVEYRQEELAGEELVIKCLLDYKFSRKNLLFEVQRT
jgi:replication factor A1